VQKIEVFAAKYLDLFTLIDLQVVETIPNEMKGELSQLSIVPNMM
jgi:hypothetical protein